MSVTKQSAITKLSLYISMYEQIVRETTPKITIAEQKGWKELAEHYRETIVLAEARIEAYVQSIQEVSQIGEGGE